MARSALYGKTGYWRHFAFLTLDKARGGKAMAGMNSLEDETKKRISKQVKCKL